jgi:hypothetical protein
MDHVNVASRSPKRKQHTDVLPGTLAFPSSLNLAVRIPTNVSKLARARAGRVINWMLVNL